MSDGEEKGFMGERDHEDNRSHVSEAIKFNFSTKLIRLAPRRVLGSHLEPVPNRARS